MLIQDVINKDKKAQLDGRPASIDQFGILRWEDEGTLVMLIDSACDGWAAYLREKEIRPEKSGELWRRGKNPVHMVVDTRTELILKPCDEIMFSISLDAHGEGIIHNRNGWTRLYPPIEDDSVERIEFEGVGIESCFDDIIIKTSSLGKGTVLNKCKAKVTIEIPKGLHECQD